MSLGVKRKPCPVPVPLDVCQLFERLALELWDKGWPAYSARAILHRIRWHHHVDVGNRSFRANNNWTPALARWFLHNHPAMSGFFDLRSSPEKHSLEDYIGPYSGTEK